MINVINRVLCHRSVSNLIGLNAKLKPMTNNVVRPLINSGNSLTYQRHAIKLINCRIGDKIYENVIAMPSKLVQHIIV